PCLSVPQRDCYSVVAMDLTQEQLAVLERLHAHGFELVAFPMYANYVGVRKGSSVSLIEPVPGSGFRLYGSPAYLVAGNFGMRFRQDGRDWFIWKKERIEATPERLAEMEAFSADLSAALQQLA
ncbi:MAG: hypothetical protein WBS18_08460, partial [Candidatus Acidiferrales bacterium]